MIFDYNTFLLIGNFLIYLIWFLSSYTKLKKFTFYNFIILWICFISFMGILSYSLELYSKVYLITGTVNTKDMDFTGFIFVFISYYIMLYPLKFLRFNYTKLNNIVYTKFFKQFEYFSLLFTIIISISLLPYTVIASTIEAVDIYTNSREDGLRLLPYFLELGVTFFKLLYLFFLPFCFFKIKYGFDKKYILFIILLFVNIIQISVVTASRGTLFVGIVSFVFMFLIFSIFYKRNIKRAIVLWITIFLSIATVLGIGITVSRTQEGEVSPVENIVLYFGESFVHYGLKIWDNPKLNRTNGLIYFPLIYDLISGETSKKFTNTQDKVDYWEYKANSGSHNTFSPIYGKLYMEFGTFVPLFILILFSLFLTFYLKNNFIDIYSFPLLTFLFSNIYFYSVFSNPLRDSILKDVIYMLVLIFLLKKTIVYQKYTHNKL